jgi:hypothetical protein
MKLDGPQFLPISVLKGALVTNPNGAEFYITGVSVDIVNHEICIELEGGGSVEWSTLRDWSIQFQGGT